MQAKEKYRSAGNKKEEFCVYSYFVCMCNVEHFISSSSLLLLLYTPTLYGKSATPDFCFTLNNELVRNERVHTPSHEHYIVLPLLLLLSFVDWFEAGCLAGWMDGWLDGQPAILHARMHSLINRHFRLLIKYKIHTAQSTQCYRLLPLSVYIYTLLLSLYIWVLPATENGFLVSTKEVASYVPMFWILSAHPTLWQNYTKFSTKFPQNKRYIQGKGEILLLILNILH